MKYFVKTYLQPLKINLLFKTKYIASLFYDILNKWNIKFYI